MIMTASEPILLEKYAIWTAGKVALAAVILLIFTFATWIVIRKSTTVQEKTDKKSKKITTAVLLAVAATLGALMFLRFGMATEVIKGMILIMILLYAGISDVAKREVPDFVAPMILILSFVCFAPESLPSMILGAAAVFIPQLFIAILKPNRGIGGADIKITTALGFMLGAEKGIAAMLIGMLLAVIITAIAKKVRKESMKDAFALLPFLSIGAIAAYMI